MILDHKWSKIRGQTSEDGGEKPLKPELYTGSKPCSPWITSLCTCAALDLRPDRGNQGAVYGAPKSCQSFTVPMLSRIDMHELMDWFDENPYIHHCFIISLLDRWICGRLHARLRAEQGIPGCDPREDAIRTLCGCTRSEHGRETRRRTKVKQQFFCTSWIWRSFPWGKCMMLNEPDWRHYLTSYNIYMYIYMWYTL